MANGLMDIRVSASAVSDGRNVPYQWDVIPDPAEFRRFRDGVAALNAAPDGQIGRNGSLPQPVLKNGIKIKRGGAAILIRGVGEDYVATLRADSTRIVEVLAEDGEEEQVINAAEPAGLALGGAFSEPAPKSRKNKGPATE